MGGVRTALYNYLFAKKHGGDFILRIEDTDQKRFVPGAEDYIKEALAWCGISPDEGPGFGGETGPYKQSERKELYAKYVQTLLDNGNAYYAFDTPEELDEMRERLKAAGVAAPQYNAGTRGTMKNSLSLSADEVDLRLKRGDAHVIRLKVPRNDEIRFEDEIRGWVVVRSSNVDDKVLYKSDGMPTYHLANIVDDHLMGITHVIRGEEWLPSAPLHILLYKAFGWDPPKFAHLPLILRPDGKGKLSKRDGDRLGFPVFPLNWTDPNTGEESSGYRERGYYPEAFVNMLAMLGWNPGTEQELFTLEELVNAFSLERVGRSGARFDPDKTLWYNQQYLRKQSDNALAERFRSDLEGAGISISAEDALTAVGLIKERAVFPQDLIDGRYLFDPEYPIDEVALQKKWSAESGPLMEEFAAHLNKLEEFDRGSIETALKEFLQVSGNKMGAIMPLFRLFVAGRMSGPGMYEVGELLGKEEVLRRIDRGLAICRTWG
jgi:glutamyl-tRNA synthetase